MSSIDAALERLLAESTFFPGLNVRLAALHPLARIAEQQLDFARETEIQRVRHEHESRGANLHAEDKGFALQDLEQQVTHLLPKLTRGGLLLMSWSIFERSIKDIAFRAAHFRASPLTGAHFRSGDLFSKADDALLKFAGTPLFEGDEQKARAQVLKALRDVLIHHEGRLDEASPVIARLGWTQLASMGVQVERDYDFEYLVPTELFLDTTVGFVYESSHSLARRVFDALNPVMER